MNEHLKITFDKAADEWEEALPIGNGRLGGMVFGYPYTERIQLNEDSVWFGGPQDRNNPSASLYLPKIRQLIFDGNISEAQELCTLALSGIPEEQRHYEPLGNLYLEFAGNQTAISDYERFLDLNTATVLIKFQKDGILFQREILSSYPDQVIAIHLTSNQPGSISFRPQLAKGLKSWDLSPYQTQTYRHPGYNVYADDIYLESGHIQIMEAQTGGKGGVNTVCGIKVIPTGGKIEEIGNTISVTSATEVMILLAADTTFRETDPKASVIKKLNQAGAKTWEQLKEAHLQDYQELFDRVHLEIEGQEHIERFFQFGRYLMIASSRPGSLPSNLQGIWNEDYAPAWGSKYTININLQMNYWPAEVCNLSECHEPLFDLLERMRENGRKTARTMYNCRGFMAHHNTDLWCDTAPQDICLSSSYWVMGAAWLSLHIWEHYLFTQDLHFLEEHYATMKEAAEFLIDFLVEDGRYLVTCPTISPENEYILPNGEKGILCKGASMDNQIISELFHACIEAEKLLGYTDDFQKELEHILERIMPIRIGKHGQIMEWNEDYEEADPGHRHISQLFALYPGSQISLMNTPSLAEAAKTTLERRLKHGGGHSGWSRAWIINMYARLGEGDKALEHIEQLLEKQTLPNLFDDHPPFQIDGNFGCTAGIAEMLVQSHDGTSVFLPALPKAWKNGSVSGLCLRGGAIIEELKWQDGAIISLKIKND